MKLSEMLKDQSVKANIVKECTRLVEEQVATKNGVSGLAIKTAYKLVKGIGPRYISGAIGRTLPAAFEALDPLWQEGLQVGDPVGYLSQNRSRTAELLLSVTDARIEHKPDGIVRSSYNRIRKSVKVDVEAAVPEFAQILQIHTQTVTIV